MNKDYEHTNQLYADAVNLQSSMNTEIRGIYKEQKRLTSEAEKEATALAKSKALRSLSIIPTVDTSSITEQLNNIAKPVTLEVGVNSTIKGADSFTKNFNDFKTQVIDISNEINAAFADIAVSVGETLGELLAGEGDWRSFGQKVATVVADLAISVGKIAITTGITTLAIDAALTSGQAYAAIAAGIALVALGTAVKAGLRNAANGSSSSSATFSGNSYSSSSGNFSSSSGSSSGFDAKSININVSGEIFSRGNKLVVAIANENQRKKLTS